MASSQTPTSRWTEWAVCSLLNLITWNGKGGCVLEHLTSLAILGCSFQRGIYIGLSKTRYVKVSSCGLFNKKNPKTQCFQRLNGFVPLYAASMLHSLFVLSVCRVVIALNSLWCFPWTASIYSCQSQPQEGGITAQGSERNCHSYCVSSSRGKDSTQWNDIDCLNTE